VSPNWLVTLTPLTYFDDGYSPEDPGVYSF
jgi:hypothetical protein